VDLTIIFHIFSTLGFGLALLLAVRIQKNLLGHPSRIFLTLFLLIYFLVGISNVLKHGGVTNYFDRFEYFAEILFPPAFLFFIFPIFSLYIFSIYMKQDFEKRMEIEESLIESEKKFRNLSEEIADGVAVTIDGKIKWVNKAFPEIFGYDIDEILDQEIGVLINPKESPANGIDPFNNSYTAKDNETRYEAIGLIKDGNRIEIEASEKVISFDNEPAIQIITRDITERKRAEEVITRAKMEWEQTFNTVPDMITILDSRNRILRVNKSMAEHLDIEPEKLIGKDFHLLVHGTNQPHNETFQNNESINGNGYSVEIYEDSPDKHYLVSVSPLKDDLGQKIGSVRVAHNISELKRVENELESTRAFLQSVIDGVTDSIMVIGSDYRVRLINKTAKEIHSVDLPLTDSHLCYKISHHVKEPCHGTEHPCPLRVAIETKEPVTLIHHHKRADGSEYSVEIAASPIINNGEVTGIIEVGRDITEKLHLEEEEKKLEARLFQQQKDQSIALLAQGIAHDFNNLLGTVVGNVDLLQMGTAPKEDECGIVEAIGSAAHKMSDLTSQLLAYAKGGTYKLEEFVLNKLILQTLKISHTGAAIRIKVVNKLAKGLWPVYADPGQMKQMLLNIFTNAFEAMEEQGGTLTVISSNKSMTEDWECALNNVHPAGDYISLDIIDTGPGVHEEIAQKAFEPFVTTKSMGRGLGLAAVAGIVQNHGGCVSFEGSTEGTTFHILLPKASENQNKFGDGAVSQSIIVPESNLVQ
jgi:PAS domain S-box-containing protein